MDHMFPTLLCWIIWYYASETDGAYDDCCLGGVFSCVECGKATYGFIGIFGV
jgi:hypothetical protein